MNPWIEVDGGVTPLNAYKVYHINDHIALSLSLRPMYCLYMMIEHNMFYLYLQVIEAGANALVAGSAVFGAKDYAQGKDSLVFSTLHL